MAREYRLTRITFLLCLCLGSCHPKPDGLKYEAYIWQRIWSSAVEEAMEKSRVELEGYVVLAGEISWTANGPTFAKAQIDYAALKRSGVHVGLALRIGPYRSAFRTDDAAANFIREKVRSTLRNARSAGVAVEELQIDFDCAQTKLSGYQTWLCLIQKTAAPIPVSITVLPSWLDEPGFRDLARQSGSFVLQVHSVQMPLKKGELPRIFDEKSAIDWTLRAGKLHLPFRVALPTYTHRIVSNSDGKILRITSEDDGVLLPDGATSQLVCSDPREIASFLAHVEKIRPPELRGFIWYRLPLATDRRNWRWETLQAVIEKKPLEFQSYVTATGDSPTDVTLENRGNIDAPIPKAIEFQWSQSRFIAADALPGWTFERTGTRLIFRPNADLQEGTLPPGKKLAIGWARLDPPEKIHVQIP